MGTYVSLVWNENGQEKHETVLKLYYASKFGYSQEEIPDGKLPDDLDVKYLASYQQWLYKLLFMAQKLPEAFMQIEKEASIESYEECIQSIKDDIANCRRADIKAKLLKKNGYAPVLHVG